MMVPTKTSTALWELAGYALAHALWSVESGETLCTFALIDGPGAERTLLRVEHADIASSIKEARQLAPAEPGAVRWAVCWDGYYGEQLDTLFIELHEAGTLPSWTLIQPYTAAGAQGDPLVDIPLHPAAPLRSEWLAALRDGQAEHRTARGAQAA